MDKDAAIELAMKKLNAAVRERDDDLVVLDEHTIYKPYGWIFFYQSRIYVECGDLSFRLVGNGPYVVMKDGSTHELGTGKPIEEEIAAFEHRYRLRKSDV